MASISPGAEPHNKLWIAKSGSSQKALGQTQSCTYSPSLDGHHQEALSDQEWIYESSCFSGIGTEWVSIVPHLTVSLSLSATVHSVTNDPGLEITNNFLWSSPRTHVIRSFAVEP